MRRTVANSGFSLIELIVVIVLTGIIAAVLGQVLSRPIEGFVDLSNRAELVDTSELALRRMSREIRLALPNSVRITDGATQNLATCTASGASGCSVEILRTADGGRYRAKPGGAGSGCPNPPAQDRLSFTASADCFEVLGTLTLPLPSATGANQLSCLNLPRSSDCLVISNTGQPGANAYNGDNIAGLTAATATSLSFDISGGAATRFPLQSPLQRFHIVDMPVSFICTGNNINRQAEYAITSLQSLTPGGSSALLANQVSSCTFTYNPGTSSRNGILTVDITMSFTSSKGVVNNLRLVEQVQVINIP
jgi:MSHA biogenesis protein MshO